MLNKVVLISGCSSGIGRSTALAALKKGARVFAGLRNPTQQSAQLLSAAESAGLSTERLHFVQLDVTSDDSVREAVAETSHSSGSRIDVLVNNAGEGLNGTIESIPLKRAQQHFDLNLWGVYRLVQSVAPVMRKQGDGGQIINISSASAFRSLPGFEVYAASKFALDGLMQGYAGIAALDGVCVTNVQPGPVATEFVARLAKERNEGLDSAEAEDAVALDSFERGLRNLAAFNEARLAQATMTGDDVAEAVVNLMETHAAGGQVPLSLQLGAGAKQVRKMVDLLL